MSHHSNLFWWWSSVDLFIATTATLLSLRFQSQAAMDTPLASLLSMRMSAKNVLLLTMLLIVWTGIHQLCGLYASASCISKRSLIRVVVIAVGLDSVFFLVSSLFSNARDRPILVPLLVFF